MNSASHESLLAQFRYLSRIAALFVVAVGVLVLFGWVFDVLVLKRLLPGWVTMKANTALCFVLAGSVLWLRTDENIGGTRRGVALAFAAVITMTGFLTLLEHYLGWNLGIDQLLFRDPGIAGMITQAPGRMTVVTALNFVLAGVTLGLWEVKMGWRASQWAALMMFSLASLGLSGYIYSFEALYKIGIYSSMALHTTLAFLALSAGILCARPQFGPMMLLSGEGMGSMLMRRLLPFAITVPLFVGWIRLEIERYHVVEMAVATAGMALFTAFFISSLVWWSGAFLNHLEKQRDETERALRESEELFSKAFRLGVDYLLIVRISDLVVIRANDALCRLWNRSPDEVIGQPTTEFGHLLSDEEFAVVDAELKEKGEILNYESVMYLKNGRTMPFTMSCRLINFHGDVCTLVVFHDLTRRRKSEMTLRASEKNWRDLAESMPPLIWTCTPDGTVDYLSAQWHKYTGISADLPTESEWKQTFMPEELVELEAAWHRCMKSGKTCEAECHIRRADGVYRWFNVNVTPARDADGKIIKWYGCNTDIHELKMAQTENERFAAIIESSADAIISKDLESIILSWNPGAQKLLGYSAQEMIGQSTSRIIAPELLDGAPEIVARVARTQQVKKLESVYIHKNGKRVPISLIISPIVDASGQVTGTSSIARDITERVKVQAELVRAKDELEERVEQRTSQLEERTAQLEETNEQLQVAKEGAEAANLAKSEFLSRMSHELRTPLNSILGFSQVMEMGNRLNARDAESVDHILKSGRHLLNLINEVLDIASIESGHLSLSPEPIHMASIVSEVLNIVRPLAAPRGIELIDRVAHDEDRYVIADQQRFRQVLLNLISNAIKYNHDGGQVTVSYGGIDGVIRLNIDDTGPGLSEVQQSKLFIPFERLGAERTQIEGTGIGLSLCKRLVKAMNGDIGVESSPGQGSTFWVEFPTVKPQSAQLAETLDESAVARTSRADARPRTLLYIEDNLLNLKLIQSVLVDRPEIELLSAMQGSIGLELALRYQPDLILLDLNLPDISGEVVLSRLQAEPMTREIPVVILSANAMLHQATDLSAVGASYYLTKPLDLKEFLHVLKSLFDE